MPILQGQTARAAALENDAAQARLEQERLKAQLAWRTLSPEQIVNLQDGWPKNQPKRISNIRLAIPKRNISQSNSLIFLKKLDGKWRCFRQQSTEPLYGDYLSGPRV